MASCWLFPTRSFHFYFINNKKKSKTLHKCVKFNAENLCLPLMTCSQRRKLQNPTLPQTFNLFNALKSFACLACITARALDLKRKEKPFHPSGAIGTSLKGRIIKKIRTTPWYDASTRHRRSRLAMQPRCRPRRSF